MDRILAAVKSADSRNALRLFTIPIAAFRIALVHHLPVALMQRTSLLFP
jgi:hypothetical protein